MTNFLLDLVRRDSISPEADTPVSSKVRSRSQERSIGLDADQTPDYYNTDSSSANGDVDDEGKIVKEDEIGEIDESVSTQATTVSSVQRGRNRGHRRSISDPVHMADKIRAESERIVSADDTDALPTLPRYPVSETKDQNCWSEPDVGKFHVRGERYFQDKKKTTSGPYLLTARGCDLLLTDNPHNSVIGENVLGALGGNLRKEPTFLVRLTFPWGLLIQYFSVPESLAPFMGPKPHPSMDNLSTSERTFAKWLKGDDDYKNERLKLISYVTEGPWVVRHMVTGKPALIGKKLPVSYSYTPANKHTGEAEFLVCDLDIGSSSKTAQRIVSVCRRYMSALTVDIGFVIQAETQEELPEQMMGCIRIHKLDTLKAPTLSH